MASSGRKSPMSSPEMGSGNKFPGISRMGVRKENRKDEKAQLARKLLGLLRETPDGVCGGLLTQKLKQAHLNLITRVYSHEGEIQRGWLQDLTRKLPEVQKNPMGRDTWYKCSAEYLTEDAEAMSPSRCTSGSSLSGNSPGFGERSPSSSMAVTPERITMETPARSDLANAVQTLLFEAPGGMSGSALGLRLRKTDPGSVDAFYGEVEPGEPKPAILDLVRSIPGVIIENKGGSEFYSLAKLPMEAFSSLLENPASPPTSRRNNNNNHSHEQHPASPLESFAELVNALIARMCSRRKQRP